jgi:hypothetical protein
VSLNEDIISIRHSQIQSLEPYLDPVNSQLSTVQHYMGFGGSLVLAHPNIIVRMCKKFRVVNITKKG